VTKLSLRLLVFDWNVLSAVVSAVGLNGGIVEVEKGGESGQCVEGFIYGWEQAKASEYSWATVGK